MQTLIMGLRHRGILFLLICFSSGSLRAQHQKQQIGIDASKFILLFNEQVNNLDLTYRYKLDSVFTLRGGLDLDLSTEEEGLSDYSVRLGVDKIFLNDKSWRFYLGSDLHYSSTILKSSQRINSNLGVSAFIGFLYKLGSNFSISSEPTVAWTQFRVKDEDEFGPSFNRKWSEIKLLNLGQIRVNFHF